MAIIRGIFILLLLLYNKLIILKFVKSDYCTDVQYTNFVKALLSDYTGVE
jgi:hypothetical protein